MYHYLVNIFNPFLDVLKRLYISDVIDEHNSMGSTVKGSSDCSEAFMACCIPETD
jgi:hypothetical protein